MLRNLCAAALLLVAGQARAEPQQLRAEVIEAYPHDAQAFTQGLLLHHGALYESTGLYGRSSLRQVELTTGKVLRRIDLPKNEFGEGLALAGAKLVQLTWREGVAPTYDLASFTRNGEFKYDGGGLGKGGTFSLFVDGTKDGEGRVEVTTPLTYSFDETCDIGRETGSPVSPDYGERDSAFSGEVNWVQIDLEQDDHDHLISPEERLRVAMARQ